MPHIRQSRPDSGLGFQVKVFKPFSVVPSSLGAIRLMSVGELVLRGSRGSNSWQQGVGRAYQSVGRACKSVGRAGRANQ